MNETKSKALLIVSLIVILAVSSIIVAFHARKTTEIQLIVTDIEKTLFPGKTTYNVWLRWLGGTTDIQITHLRASSLNAWYDDLGGWTEHASYGYTFNFTFTKGTYNVIPGDHALIVAGDLVLKLHYDGTLYYSSGTHSYEGSAEIYSTFT